MSAAWLAVVLALLVTGAPERLSRSIFEARSASARLIFQKDSPYSYIQVVDKPLPGGRERTLRLDALIHNKYSPADPDDLLYHYERIFAALTAGYSADVVRGGAFSTLTLGGGAFTLPAYLERRYPAAAHTVVEFDPEVVRVAGRFFDVPARGAIRVVVEDARRYMEEARGKERYDLIYCDAFNAYSVPAHLTTRQFIREAAGLLAPRGIFLANVIDILDSGRFLGAYLETLRSVFPNTRVYMPVGAAPDARTTFVVAATAGWAPPDVLSDSDGKQVAVTVQPEMLRRLQRGRPMILTDDHAPVENLMAPVFLRSVN